MDVSACLVGNSVPIRDLLKDIELAALSDAAVLITGEKGVGKTPTLVQHHLRYQSEARNRTPDVSPAAMERLVESDWPGNVRQIAEIVAQFVARGAVTIDAHHLPKDIFETRRDATEMFG